MTINPLDIINGSKAATSKTQKDAASASEKTDSAATLTQIEDELQTLDLSDASSFETLGKMMDETQEAQSKALAEKYQGIVKQIQLELANVQKEKRLVMMELSSYRPKEGEENKMGDFINSMSQLTKKSNKLHAQLANTMSDYEMSVKQMEIAAQQNVLSLQNMMTTLNTASAPAAISTTSQGTPQTAANTASGGKITSNLDGSTPQIDGWIEKYANEAGLDPNFVKAVVKAESSFNPNAGSSAGAQGLMQLMPATAASLGVSNAFDPEQNIKGGVKYLKQMYDQFKNYDLALAAYNAGPGAVQKYGGIPPYAETQNYVQKVNQFWNSYKSA